MVLKNDAKKNSIAKAQRKVEGIMEDTEDKEDSEDIV
jgi:hypothetical protein